MKLDYHSFECFRFTFCFASLLLVQAVKFTKTPAGMPNKPTVNSKANSRLMSINSSILITLLLISILF